MKHLHPTTPDDQAVEVQALLAHNQTLSEQLALALEAAQMCTFVWDPVTNDLTLSPSAAAVWGISLDTLPQTGTALLQLVHPHDRGQYQALLWTAREHGNAYRHEYRLIRPQDGRILWVEEHGRVTTNPLTGTLQVQAVQRDVTERQRTKSQLLYHESRLHGLLDIDAVGIIFLDPNGVLREANRAFLSLTGYTQADIDAGRLHWQTLTPPEWMAISLEQMARLAQTGRIGPYEKEYLCRDGGRVWLLFAGTKLRDGMLVEFCIDITERKQAEAALRESEARHYVAVDAASIGDWTYDVATSDLSCSPRARAMHRVGPDEPFGMAEHEQLIHPADRAAVRAARAAALNPTGSGHYSIEYRLCFPDEEERWIESVGRAVMVEEDERRRATHLIGVMMDITQRKQTDERLRRQNAVLAAMNRIFREALTHSTEAALGNVCLQATEELTQSQFSFIAQHNLSTGAIEQIATSGTGWDPPSLDTAGVPARLLTGGADLEGRFGDLWREGKAFFTNTPAPPFDRLGIPPNQPPLQAFLASPLTHGGQTLGMIGMGKVEGKYTQEDLEVVEALAPAMVQALLSKRTEVALRESETRFRELAEAVPDIVFTTTPDGVVEYVNPRMEALTGHPVADVLGTYIWSDLVHPDDQPAVEAQGVQAYREHSPMESRYRLEMADGSYHWVMARARPIFSKEAEVVRWFGTISDIDPLMRAEAQLRQWNEMLEARVAERTQQVEALTISLTLAEQQERQRVSHILHDDLQQLLYSLLMRLHLLQRTATVEMLEPITAIVDQLHQAVSVTRSLVTELNPPILATDGLPTALAWLADHMLHMYALRVDLQVRSFCEPRTREIRALLIQMVREVLFNVVKHSGTGAARLVVEGTVEGVEVHVEDDGIGFEGERVLQKRGGRGAFGLRSIADRLTLIGGEITIQAAPGQGSCVTLKVPCDPATLPVVGGA